MTMMGDNMLNFLTTFFEEMDEMVYISDMESNEVVYMNRLLRESLGYTSESEYRNRKCYQVLQGLEVPCDFCNNAVLENGRFYSWIHRNPILNRRFLVKDSQFDCGGRKYRMEIAINMDSQAAGGGPYFFSRSEQILNECIQRVFSTTDPEESLEKIMAYIGETFQCDRVYIFEFTDTVADNTYEWCGNGVEPQKEILQEVLLSDFQEWIDLFRKKDSVIISDLEDIRMEVPTIYAILKPQNIQRLTAGPIIENDRLTGFIGVDNPQKEMIGLISSVFKVIGFFIVSLLKRRDLLRRLNAMSYQDALTGAFNRNALFERYAKPWNGTSMAVVFCDVTGLKQTNDMLGHAEGDQLIRHSCQVLRDSLQTPDIFRAGGDEFVAVFRDIDEREFLEKVRVLQQAVRDDTRHIAVGYAWSDQTPISLENLITQADKVMYQDKREYYEMNRRVPGVDRRESSRGRVRGDSPFYNFMNSTYCDMEQFFNAVSQQNTTSYFYFGDMQKDMFYISDNMRDEFGFESNIVSGLLKDWASRIATVKEREMYRAELENMLTEKRSIHDMRYQVRTAQGKNLWIRCYGILKWNEDKSVPLFFSGRVTHQDEEFVVDPITNFPRESTMFRKLDTKKNNGESVFAVGFSLNNVAEINSTRGRAHCDKMIGSISQELMEKLSDRADFYRLEGMRCIAVMDSSQAENKEELVREIRSIISGWYALVGLSIRNPSSVAVMEYSPAEIAPADFLEQMISLIKMAKHENNLEYVEYSNANLEKSKRLSHMALGLSHDVLNGMQNFRIMVQPIVSSREGRIRGCEALLRWTFEGENVPPSIFIPMLEKDNMIHTAGRWVFEQAVCTCLRMNAYDPDLYMSFNVSLHQMSDEGFTDFMRATLEKYKVNGSHLVAEVTESCMDENPERLLRFVNECREMGVQLALDDFGSGYSSFHMLLKYPTDIVKVDRSLLGEMTESNEKKNFISSIVYACHRFGKTVCMEGVETEEQYHMILQSGCDTVQGYYCYRPMELDRAYRLLAGKTGRRPGTDRKREI